MKTSDETASSRRLMYVEKKDGDIDGAAARIGWVTISAGGTAVYYRGRTLNRSGDEGVRGSYVDEGTGHEYWICRIKPTGSHAHFVTRVAVRIDADARYEYRRIRTGAG